MSDQYEIYFHVGTGKTGSTFLQARIFPLLKGIHYIPTNRYHKIFLEIEKYSSTKILISREFDQQLEREVKRFSEKHTNTNPIIIFRRHDSYIASQYRRFVKNGFTGKSCNNGKIEANDRRNDGKTRVENRKNPINTLE